MRVLGKFQTVHFLTRLQDMSGGPDLAVGTPIAGAAPIDAALQLAIHHELVLVDDQLPLPLPGATKTGQARRIWKVRARVSDRKQRVLKNKVET